MAKVEDVHSKDSLDAEAIREKPGAEEASYVEKALGLALLLILALVGTIGGLGTAIQAPLRPGQQSFQRASLDFRSG